ncbi:MAG: hypothetical protein JHC84_18625 [Solirubrobacteraceae bacterium]|nr:hypothetical protein [Solirubrobacteraceae bacterium]
MSRAQRIGVALAVLGVSFSGTASAASTAKVGCGQKSGGQFPGAFEAPANLVVGPFVLVGWHQGTSSVFAANPGRPLRWKMPAFVRDGRRVTVRIAREARDRARLAYATRDAVALSDHPWQITFTACSRKKGERSHSSVDGKPVTFWSGGVVFQTAPACVPIEFRHDWSRVWRTRTLKLATTDC